MDSIATQSHPHGPEPRHQYAPEVQTNNELLCEGTDKPLSHSTCYTFSLSWPTFNHLMTLRSQHRHSESNISSIKRQHNYLLPHWFSCMRFQLCLDSVAPVLPLRNTHTCCIKHNSAVKVNIRWKMSLCQHLRLLWSRVWHRRRRNDPETFS